MLVDYLVALLFVIILVCIVSLAFFLLDRRGKHHYDNQDPDGSCDPMDDKLDEYDND